MLLTRERELLTFLIAKACLPTFLFVKKGSLRPSYGNQYVVKIRRLLASHFMIIENHGPGLLSRIFKNGWRNGGGEIGPMKGFLHGLSPQDISMIK